MPQVMDYVQQKADEHELERQMAGWRRKLEIAEVEARRYQNVARKLGIAGE